MGGDNSDIAHASAACRTVGTDHLLVAALTLVMGGSVIALVGQYTAAQAGPAIVLSLLLAALGTLPMLYCLREAMRRSPAAGGLYALLHAAWGRRVAAALTILLVLELILTVAGLAQSTSQHLQAATEAAGLVPGDGLPPPLAAAMTLLPLGACAALWHPRPVLLLACALLTVKLGIGLLLLLLAARHVHYAHWIPWLPSAVAPYRFGLGGVLAASVPLLGILLGTGLLAGFAGLASRPRAQVSKAANGGVLGAMLLLMGLAALQSGLVEFAALASPRPLSVALQGLPQLQWLLPLLPLAGGAGLAALQLVLLLLAARLSDAVWPPAGRPARGTITLSLVLVAAVLAVWLPEGHLPQLPGAAALLVQAAVCMGTLRQLPAADGAVRSRRAAALRLLAPLAALLCLLPVLQRIPLPLLA